MSERKSEWCRISLFTDTDKQAVASWFYGLIDDCEIMSAEVLVDIATDKQKKLRATVRTPDGQEKIAERTYGRNPKVSLRRVA